MLKRILVLSLLATSLAVFINACENSGSDEKYGADAASICCMAYNSKTYHSQPCYAKAPATSCPGNWIAWGPSNNTGSGYCNDQLIFPDKIKDCVDLVEDDSQKPTTNNATKKCCLGFNTTTYLIQPCYAYAPARDCPVSWYGWEHYCSEALNFPDWIQDCTVIPGFTKYNP